MKLGINCSKIKCLLDITILEGSIQLAGIYSSMVPFSIGDRARMELTLALPKANPAVGFNDTVIYQDFNYKSGFKVAAGFKSDEYDDWGGKVEYTRLHGTHSNNATAPNLGIGFLNMEPWINDVQGNGVRADAFGSNWSVDLDVIDVGLFRTYYVGRHLVFQTFFVGRGGWLDQSLNFDVQVPINPLPNPGLSRTTSDSWSLGTKGSIDTNWILGYGLRLIGNAEVSFFFQRYKLRHAEKEVDNITENGVNSTLTVRFLRPTLGLQLRLGWGTYAWNQTVHIDFEATYDYMTWWAQNMLRMFADVTNITRSGSEGEPGNLYYQGLTLRGQLNF